MRGLPQNIDLSFLIGKRLYQVCFGEHDLILRFDEPVSISIESAISLSLPDGKANKWDDLRQGAGFLVSLISNEVANVHGTTDGTLTLEFKEGGVFKIYDNNKQYESYHIQNGEKVIVV